MAYQLVVLQNPVNLESGTIQSQILKYCSTNFPNTDTSTVQTNNGALILFLADQDLSQLLQKELTGKGKQFHDMGYRFYYGDQVVARYLIRNLCLSSREIAEDGLVSLKQIESLASQLVDDPYLDNLIDLLTKYYDAVLSSKLDLTSDRAVIKRLQFEHWQDSQRTMNLV